MKAKTQPPPAEIRVPYSFSGGYYVDYWRTEKFSDMDLVYVRKKITPKQGTNRWTSTD